MINYDVVIVGAGPAGSYLAYKLKNQGIQVLLLEKEVFPRYKACAGGISKKTYDILFAEFNDIKKIVERKVKKGLFVRNKRFTFRESDKELIFMTYRSNLDNYLVNKVSDNKTVHFKDNVSIQKINRKDNTLTYLEENKEHKVSYRVLVGAWGGNIRLNRIVNLYPFERMAVSSSWEGPIGPKFKEYFNEYAECQILQKYPGAVGYIFPKSEKITAGLFTSLHPVPFDLKNMWKDFMEFWGLDTNIKPRYAIIPIRDMRKPVAEKNILLVGDAGGLADPFTGEGLYYAFISSQVASKHILNYFQNQNYDLAHKYTKDIDSNLLDIHKWARIYEFLFQHFTNITFWFGSECILGNEIMYSFLTGDIKYNKISKIIIYPIKRLLGVR